MTLNVCDNAFNKNGNVCDDDYVDDDDGGDGDYKNDDDSSIKMKTLLGSLDSHLGQRGKTFLSGDKVVMKKIIMIII